MFLNCALFYPMRAPLRVPYNHRFYSGIPWASTTFFIFLCLASFQLTVMLPSSIIYAIIAGTGKFVNSF